MRARRQDDPEVVRREYADESRFVARVSFWERRPGPAPIDIALRAILELKPRRVLEVGCGRGGFAEKLQREGLEVVAVDQSERMVELTRARGVDVRVADVQSLPFEDDSFDLATANFMLYHVTDIDRGLAELARVAPRLVATTNGIRHMHEVWDMVGRDLDEKRELFMVETGGAMLRRHYADVRLIDASTTMEATAEEIRNYVANSVAHRDLADRVRAFAGTMPITASTAVFVASNAA